MKTSLCFVQNKYKESGKKSQSVSVYSQLPETNDTQFAKAVCQIQSEVRSGTLPNPVRYCGQTRKHNQTVSYFSRTNTKKRRRGTHPAVCTRSCRRLRRLCAPKRLRSCRVRCVQVLCDAFRFRTNIWFVPNPTVSMVVLRSFITRTEAEKGQSFLFISSDHKVNYWTTLRE